MCKKLVNYNSYSRRRYKESYILFRKRLNHQESRYLGKLNRRKQLRGDTANYRHSRKWLWNMVNFPQECTMRANWRYVSSYAMLLTYLCLALLPSYYYNIATFQNTFWIIFSLILPNMERNDREYWKSRWYFQLVFFSFLKK